MLKEVDLVAGNGGRREQSTSEGIAVGRDVSDSKESERSAQPGSQAAHTA